MQRPDEMEAPDFVAKPVIEPVGGVVGSVAVEDENIAALVAAELLEVLQQGGPDARGAVCGMDDEVVDLKVFSAPDFGRDPNPGEADHFALLGKDADGVVMRVVAQDGLEPIPQHRGRAVRVEVREQADRGR